MVSSVTKQKFVVCISEDSSIKSELVYVCVCCNASRILIATHARARSQKNKD